MSSDTSCFVDVPLNKIDWSFHHSWPLPHSLGLYALIGAFTAHAVWSSIPLTIRLIFKFKKRQGLYFWSVLVVTWSLNIRAIGYMLRYAVPSVSRTSTGVISNIGWVGMVTGFSVVLYSRLGLLLNNRSVLQLILAMIIVDGVCLHTSTIVAQSGYASYPSNDPRRRPWIRALDVVQRLQGIVFAAQQFVISGVYIIAAWKHLKSSTASQQKVRRLMQSLIAVQVLVFCMDVAIIAIECAGYFVIKMIIHSFVYSIKLEIEFVVLNNLVALSQVGVGQMAQPYGDLEAGPGDVEFAWAGPSERKGDTETTIAPASPVSDFIPD